ncbi:hypothetical protein ID850_19540 [Xenorhabdus sp. Flor]|uniref:hypothetical protein n=1 Tax=Xenorhabdus cabanillasii TaxID=351673 RepID=UPI0019AB5B02|nr:hypothetical protein [Xenorhabdus sp. Flor]MBD2816861.1 hypothetical protein [Xenorhabdus sp. Flor]
MGAWENRPSHLFNRLLLKVKTYQKKTMAPELLRLAGRQAGPDPARHGHLRAGIPVER